MDFVTFVVNFQNFSVPTGTFTTIPTLLQNVLRELNGKGFIFNIFRWGVIMKKHEIANVKEKNSFWFLTLLGNFILNLDWSLSHFSRYILVESF